MYQILSESVVVSIKLFVTYLICVSLIFYVTDYFEFSQMTSKNIETVSFIKILLHLLFFVNLQYYILSKNSLKYPFNLLKKVRLNS